MKDAIPGIVSVVIAITGIALLGVLVSNAAQTSNVFSGLGQSLAQMICTATSPVTGKTCQSLIPTVSSTITF